MVFITALRQASKRVPMIKFRKGGPVMSASAGSQPQAAGSPAHAGGSIPGVAIEDWQLPPRYQRKPIDPVEMEYINNGGPPA
ncbi:unnamed protein product [Hermetia illucens]|uniref:Uncharacterized protein n=1 Tax=Hermetia illucens TaxID=343691 RepID=A0A7R8UYD8_HERIL|nr:uncharacterized protein LOC119654559 isoform X2 [Hermetia illucens]CAD7089430.1 unnamed protein product [Hermetia illucens]